MIIKKTRTRQISITIVLVMLLAFTQFSQPARAEGDTFCVVSAGADHAMAIKTNGSLWGWGRNDYGQLGNGTTNRDLMYRPLPEKIMDDAVSVSVGGFHTMVIKTDGSLWAFGGNDYGQLGDGTTVDYHSPVKVMEGVVSVSAAHEYTMAVKTDGSLWAWGRNHYGQLGDGTTIDRYYTVKIMDDVVSVSTTDERTMVVKKNGSLWAWGNNESSQLGDGTLDNQYSPVKIMDNAVSVSVGGDFAMAILTDNSLWAWGANGCGELGIGSLTAQPTPVKIMNEVAAASAGGAHAMVIKTDGSLWVWGHNSCGQLGNGAGGDFTDSSVPIKIMEGVLNISASRGASSMAINKDGALYAWGENSYGILGNGKLEHSNVPVVVSAFDISVSIDGQRIAFDVPPQIVNNRALVPLRGVFEALGATVSWDQKTQTVTVVKDDITILLTIGSASPTVNGTTVTIDQPGIIVNGRTLVPVRFITESFGVSVDWDGSSKTVIIRS